MNGVDARQRVLNGIDDGRLDGIGQLTEPIVDPEPLPTRIDEARSPKVGEMPRRFRLRDLERLVDIAYADLAGQQEAENAKPGLVGERLEERFHPAQPVRHISVLTNISRAATVLIFAYANTGAAHVRHAAG